MKFASLDSAFATNQDAEVNGIEVEFDAMNGGPPMFFMVARAGGANKRFRKAIEEATRKYRQQNMDLDRLPPEVDNSINAKVWARTVHHNWRGVLDDNGNEIPFSPENAETAFKDNPEFMNFIIRESNNVNNFTEALRKSQEKN